MPVLLAALRALAYAYHSNKPTNEPNVQLCHAKHRVTQLLRAVRVADDARLCEFCCVSGRKLCNCRCRIHLFRRVSEVQICVEVLRTKKACIVVSLTFLRVYTVSCAVRCCAWPVLLWQIASLLSLGHGLQRAMLRLTPGHAGVIVQIHTKRPETTSTFALQLLQMDTHRLQIHARRGHRTVRDGCSHVSEGVDVW